MTLPRQLRSATSLEDDSLFPVGLGSLESGNVSGELLEALEALSTALTDAWVGEPKPLVVALARLTEADVEHALNSTPVQWRRNLLSTLRIPVDGARVNRALCRDVLARLQRNPETSRARQAACHLTYPVVHDLALAGFRYTGGVPEDTSRPLTHRWSPALLRLTAWTRLEVSIDDAHLWSWAMLQPWMVDMGIPLKVVLVAAQRVVELAPDTTRANRDEDQEEPLNTSALRSADEAGSPDELEPGTDSAALPDAEQLNRSFRQVADMLQAAVEPVRRTAEAIAQQTRPVDSDLAALLDVATAFDAAALALAAHGVVPTTSDLASYARETDVAVRRLSSAPLRERLGQMARLRCGPGDAALAQDLETAQERARAIAETADWSLAHQEDAEAINALLTMVELHAADHHPAEILALLPTAVKRRWLAYPAGRYTELLLQPGSEDGAEATRQVVPVPSELELETPVPTLENATAAPARRERDFTASAGQGGNASDDVTTPGEATVSAAVREPQPTERLPEMTGQASSVPADALILRPAEPEPEVEPVDASGTAPSARHQSMPADSSAEDPTPESRTSLAGLVSAERYGLAASLAAGLGEPSQRIAALQLAACAEAARSASSESVSRIRTLLAGPDLDDLTASRAEAALATSALLRAVLVTGDSEAGASLGRVATGLPPGLVQVADEVAQRALKSLLVHSPPLALARDSAELERALEDAREDCRQGLDQVPSIRFPRGNKIVRHWWDAEKGLVGSLLRHAVDDDRTGLEALSRTVRELRDPTVIQSRLDKMDRELMSPGARTRLEGPARQDLLRHTADRLALVDRWCRLARELAARDSDWSADQVQEMRSAVLGLREDVLREVREQVAVADVVAAATLEATVTSLARTFDLLSGVARLDDIELSAELALHAELLKVPGAVVDAATGSVRYPEVPAVELAQAAEGSWEEAVRCQAAHEHFATARQLLDLWTKRQLPGLGEQPSPSESLRAVVLESGKQVAQELRETRQRLEESLRRARVDGALTEERERAFERRIQDAVPEPHCDLASVRRELEALSGELNRAHASHSAALRTRLREIDGLHADDQERVEQLIETGDLLTADELISNLVNGESIPETRSKDRSLAAFLPEVPTELAGTGISRELIDAARHQKRFLGLEALDYSALSPEIAEQSAQALAGWADLASRKGSARTQGVRESELLMPALRLIGYSSKKGPQRVDLPRSGSYRFLDIPSVDYTGSALVPAFGSGLRGSLRVMLVWDRPSAETLTSWIQQDPNDDSLVVAYFGTLSVRDRSVLAAQSARGRRAVVVLDDAALAHLAACGNQRLDSAMRVLLPFSAVNPYVMGKRAPVSEEMFFGRDKELTSVQRATGDQVVFGGRGLGKSALLKQAGRKYEAQVPDSRFSLLLSLDSTFTGTNAPSATVWDRIGRRLIERGALVLPRKVKADGVLAYQHVLDGMKAWLNEDTKRGLLIMLDEADGFFESDSPQFTETRRLRDLGAETEDRVKVVFAGLHSVQRYAKIAVNSPFSHLAQRPTVIGPLRPQDAAKLLIEPLAVLGYEFEEPALVHRILGHCSYQPFLLQMFGHRLVQTMHAKRTGVASGPPYTITRADVEEVQSDRELRASITEAFHDTLRLDSRYNVIANVVAYHAHHYGLDAKLSQLQLREACTYWWPEGFENLDTDQFRAYLSEMEGLGVLAPDPDHRGWHLRSANALSMIGNLGMVEAELEEASSRKVAEHFSQFEARHRSRDGQSHSPLTADQIADVLPGHGNQARLIIGAVATGIDRVGAALRDVAEATGWEMPHVSKRSDFDRELVVGRPGQQRVVVSDLRVKAPSEDACRGTLESAVRRTPSAAGVTRSAVIIAGPEQPLLWAIAFGDSQGNGIEVESVPLRRFTSDGLRSWAQDKEAFTSESQLEQLRDRTGGWPVLVHKLSAALDEGLHGDRALRKALAGLEDADGAREFLTEAGLIPRTAQWAGYRAVLEFMTADGMTLDDLRTAIEADADGDSMDAAYVLRLLRALQVFDVTADGKHHLEAVLRDAWKRADIG
ncbi:hypothetical protein [Kitasatospora purpeofusca]|uniref:AAA+ ATPase domain-containing protein n=1 Tax=Kitasatospora purpeofusca TaxID=67352 RepID=A0ABZ1TUT4_9ACTN|nr:hypothetical protein [Kitasatospora purpeofusca]